MHYRDLIDIPQIAWTPLDQRFSVPDPARTPGLTEKRGRGRPPAEQTQWAHLSHRDLGCPGPWRKLGKNKQGQPRVFCNKCHATRLAGGQISKGRSSQ